MKKFLFSAVSFVFVIFFALKAQADDLKRLREANQNATPCGLYLTFIANNSSGVKVADADPESVRAFFDSKPDLQSKLLYIDRDSGKTYKSAEELNKALAAGTAMPIMNHPELVWVGLPEWGAEKRALTDLTEAQLDEKIPNSNITVRDLWRPNREMSSLPAYIYQQIRYLFPSLKLDYQKPLPAEKSAAYWKLLISNGSQQIFLFFVRPWNVALSTGVVNFANSYGTGVYRRFMSNWFNRSVNTPARWARNFGLSGFFTADLYWSGRETWEKFKAIASLRGWKNFVHDKWGSTFFGVLWRYYYQQGIMKWEKEMEARGRSGDARRTAGRLEFVGTFITTPAFIYSTIAPARFMLSLLGVPIMGMNEGHFLMIGVGIIGALHYYQAPMSLNWYWSQLTRTRYEGDPKRFTWDPWVERLDKFNSFNKRWASRVGVTQAIEFAERTIKLIASGEKKKSGTTVELNSEFKTLIAMDGNLEKWLSQDPELARMIREDPQLRDLIEKDPAFIELRDELLKKAE